jgi:hypothetical protein
MTCDIARVYRIKSSLKKPHPALPKINFGEGKEKKKTGKNREI